MSDNSAISRETPRMNGNVVESVDGLVDGLVRPAVEKITVTLYAGKGQDKDRIYELTPSGIKQFKNGVDVMHMVPGVDYSYRDQPSLYRGITHS